MWLCEAPSASPAMYNEPPESRTHIQLITGALPLLQAVLNKSKIFPGSLLIQNFMKVLQPFVVQKVCL